MGINKYKVGRSLKNAVNDARAVRDLLKRHGVIVVYAEDVSKKQFDTIVDQYVESLQANDAAIVFFAGHGCEYKNATRLMAISDSPQPDLKKRSVNVLVLLDRLTSIKSHSRLCLLLCYIVMPTELQ